MLWLAWLLKLNKVSKTVALGYPAHWSLMALNTIMPYSHCINGGQHVAAWPGASFSVFSHHPVLPPKGKKNFRRWLSLRSSLLLCSEHVRVTLSSLLWLSHGSSKTHLLSPDATSCLYFPICVLLNTASSYVSDLQRFFYLFLRTQQSDGFT